MCLRVLVAGEYDSDPLEMFDSHLVECCRKQDAGLDGSLVATKTSHPKLVFLLTLVLYLRESCVHMKLSVPGRQNHCAPPQFWSEEDLSVSEPLMRVSIKAGKTFHSSARSREERKTPLVSAFVNPWLVVSYNPGSCSLVCVDMNTCIKLWKQTGTGVLAATTSN